jgi:hypothetical protein
VAYASDRSGEETWIWLQQVAGGEPIRLYGTPPEFDPHFARRHANRVSLGP